MNNIDPKTTSPALSIVMLGATGAVGTETVKELIKSTKVKKLTLLGRRALPEITEPFVYQHSIDIWEPSSYRELLIEHNVAICTLGVGQPSKISKEEFIKIDKTAVIDFATACKKSGVRHFELLASVGINQESSSFYLRTKGELVEELKALNFDRLSVFQPSMILTPNNRYGFAQALTLFIWPILNPLLLGSLGKYRGIRVDQLGKAIAVNIFKQGSGLEMLSWNDFQLLAKD